MRVLRNPVIRGFAPDPSLIRVGEWYYVATSSFEWFPTIPIHRSRDLVSWEYAGHVRGAVPGGSLNGVPDSGGIWAPALSWDGERFWVVYAIVRSVMTPYFNLEVYVSTAASPGGGWSTPRRVSGTGFDPSLFHHDGRLWLLNLRNDHRPGGNRFDGIVLTELDRDTLAPLGPPRLILRRDPGDRLIEGPKLLFRDGWFYLVLAEGGTGFEHGVLVARSRDIAGPYELHDKPLLTSRDDPTLALQKAGHGELVQTPDGNWFLGHLASRPVRTVHGPRCMLGRETAIQAILWDADGWPRLRQGGWHAAVDVEVPEAVGADSQPSAIDTAEPDLAWPWSTLRGYPDASWADTTSRPGWIRLRGRHGPESLWDQSLLAQRITEHQAGVEATVDAQPTTFTQAAGLVLWYNTEAYLSLDLTWHEGRTALVLTARNPDGARVEAVHAVPPGEPVTAGATIDGAAARFWTRDGDREVPVGGTLDFSDLSDDAGGKLRFTGAFAGIRAHDLVDGTFTADFRGFRLRT
ncbi:MAG: family 43 glycosylhydrolase [Catenulispora sp.]|nr:family 43 glycosylhydrolase [Catenulispora sp.]